jgi:hypothetical protein
MSALPRAGGQDLFEYLKCRLSFWRFFYESSYFVKISIKEDENRNPFQTQRSIFVHEVGILISLEDFHFPV